MRATLLLSCLLVISFVITNAQDEWVLQCPRPTIGSLKAVAQCGLSTACAVGDFGAILRTTDFGETWTKIKVIQSWNLIGIAFFDSMRGICVETMGKALSTTDAGLTWAEVPSLPGAPMIMNRVVFVNETTWFGVGVLGTIWRTTNGGNWWNVSYSSLKKPFNSIATIGDSIAIAVGDSGSIVRSNDVGSTWEIVQYDSLADLMDVEVVDSKTVVAVGYRESGAVYTSSDAGKSWSFKVMTTLSKLRGVSFQSKLQGSIVGSRGAVLSTSDGGSTWTEQPIGKTDLEDTLIGVHCFDEQHRIVFGYNSIFSTSDAGRNWIDRVYSPATRPLRQISFVDNDHGIAVGDRGLIVSTSNAGLTWLERQSGTTSDLHDVAMIDSMFSMAVGSQGTVIHTSDGGVTWVELPKPTAMGLNGISYTSHSVITVVGDSGTIYRSIDSGRSWSRQFLAAEFSQIDLPAFTCNSVAFSDEPHGMVVLVFHDGGSQPSSLLIYTEDGGDTWKTRYFMTPTLRSVEMLDSLTAIVLGLEGDLNQTTDGGESWETLFLGFREQWYQAAFIDKRSYAVLGTGGIVAQTKDAGYSWYFSKMSNAELVSICAAGDREYAAAGSLSKGAIYRSHVDTVLTALEDTYSLSPSKLFLQCYPNPAQHHITIRFQGEPVGPVHVELVDVLGTSISTLCEPLCSGGYCECSVATNSMAQGMYLLRVTDVDGLQGSAHSRTATVIVTP